MKLFSTNRIVASVPGAVACVVSCTMMTLGVAGAAGDSEAIQAMLDAAKPGETVKLEAKTYQAGGLRVPAGVTLQGAGIGKTILVATGSQEGISLVNADGAAVSDLSVERADNQCIHVEGGKGIKLANLGLYDALAGFNFQGVTEGRIENCLIARNRTGGVIGKNTTSSVVNCSFVLNNVIALSLSETKGCAVFNNIFAMSNTGLYVSHNNEDLIIDSNVYQVEFFGKREGEAARTAIHGWSRKTGFDKHSGAPDIIFANPDANDFRVVSTYEWAPDWPATGFWGVEKVGAFSAPATDSLGTPRKDRVQTGAVWSKNEVGSRPDGSFTIKENDGVKSAAIYDAKNVQRIQFFQVEALPAGTYDYWLSARDTWGKPLEAGNYDLRLIESQLTNKYHGLSGNFGTFGGISYSRSWAEEIFVFSPDNRIFILNNSFENGNGIRAWDKEYTTPGWIIPGGGDNVGGTADDAFIYYIQKVGENFAFSLRRTGFDSGRVDAFPDGDFSKIYEIGERFSAKLYGLTYLDGVLYMSDPEKGKIFYGNVSDASMDKSFDLPDAMCVSADAKTGLLWVMTTGGQIVALDAKTGEKKSALPALPGVHRISACNGRLAAMCLGDGKVHIFDVSNPSAPKETRTIGLGDGPYGPIKADRFWFQGTEPGSVKLSLTLNSEGSLMVIDNIRTSFWDVDGNLKKEGLGFWGQHTYIGKLAGDDDIRAFSISGEYSIKYNSKNKSWEPDLYLERPAYNLESRSIRNVFTTGGKNFIVYETQMENLPGTNGDKRNVILVTRLEGSKLIPVTGYFHDGETVCEMHDTNGDNFVGEGDTPQKLFMADGSAIPVLDDRYGTLPWGTTGDFSSMGNAEPDGLGFITRMTGLDPSGNYPVYDFAHREKIFAKATNDTADMISPFDYTTVENLARSRVIQGVDIAGGGKAISLCLGTSGGTGLANGAGTDVLGFADDGTPRWIYKLNKVQGGQGVQGLPEHDLILTMQSTQCDYYAMDRDGLGLAVLSMSPESNWRGMWSDHAQQQWAWTGNDGNPHYILGDYSANGMHWHEIIGRNEVKKTSTPLKISESKANEYAASPEKQKEIPAKVPPTEITIKKLAGPMTMDGDLAKWRSVIPAAIITPENGSFTMGGIDDCSAIVRFGWFDIDLYVQVIVFDDFVTMHQSNIDMMYKQDGIEMGLNGFMQGCKFNMSQINGETVFERNKFVMPGVTHRYTPDEVQRSLKIYDNAKDIQERALVESLYGTDLSNSRAIVYEFKLPFGPTGTALNKPEGVPSEIVPGESVYLGFFINDNDLPGADIQKYLAWPATYGTFNVKETGAKATFGE